MLRLFGRRHISREAAEIIGRALRMWLDYRLKMTGEGAKRALRKARKSSGLSKSSISLKRRPDVLGAVKPRDLTDLGTNARLLGAGR
jgi:hypothetical protein